ncbi:MAG: hypothetical protein V4474_02975 [Patescibacteria group bacterium]
MTLIPKILIGLAILAAGYVGYLYFPTFQKTEIPQSNVTATTTGQVIAGADSKTFVALNTVYGKDSKSVYVIFLVKRTSRVQLTKQIQIPS